MFCSKCGGQVPDGTRFCPNCGTDLSLGKQFANSANNMFNDAEKQMGNAFNDIHNTFANGGNVPPYGGEKLQTDRSLAMYILLSIITCGIYSYYFIYTGQ